MTHFSQDVGHVRCDRFKISGKWYDTFMIDMSGLWNGALSSGGHSIHDAVRIAIQQSLPSRYRNNLGDFIYVVLEPYHEHAHPVMLRGGEE